jgi:hypothetical protein
MKELTIKVPAPFSGVSDLGFTAHYAAQADQGALRDVPLLIEGPARPMRRLVDHLRILRSTREAPYKWSDPVQLSDEVVVMSFRESSGEGRMLADGVRSSVDYFHNLMRPVVFPFLHDCATIAGLRLADHIEFRVQVSSQVLDMNLRLDQIVQPNGDTLLWSF